MNLKKYNQGIKDRLEGFPPNRFMRSDPEYMAGYNSGRVTIVYEAPKDGSGKTVPMGMLVGGRAMSVHVEPDGISMPLDDTEGPFQEPQAEASGEGAERTAITKEISNDN